MLRIASRFSTSARTCGNRLGAATAAHNPPLNVSGSKNGHAKSCGCHACSGANCGCPACSMTKRNYAVQSQSSYDIPKTQRAVVFETQDGPLQVRDDWPVVQQKDLKPGEVLVRIAYSGVCHTDYHVWKGDWPLQNKLPLVGGHEGSGYVAAIGNNTQTTLKIGDPVGIKWLADSCLGCEDCRKGHEPTCEHAEMHGFSVDGSFQQWAVSYADHVTPIPKDMPMDAAAPILCAGVTVYKALKEVGGNAGDYIVIPGAGGGLGHLACQYAKAIGYHVIAIDTGAEKKKLIESYGIKDFIDYKEGNVEQKVKDLTGGRGAHGVTVVASSSEAYTDALSFLRPHGKVVIVGLPKDTKIEADVLNSVLFSHRIVGSYVGNRQDAVEALRVAASGDAATSFKVEPLSNLPDVFDRMQNYKLAGRIVLDCE